MSVSADGSPRYTLISFATAWGPQHGGINAFNADLLEAVAAGFWERVESVCVVLDASEDEIQRFRDRGIILVSLGLRDQRQMPATLEPQAWAALTTCLDSLRAGDHNHIVWLGHDRITGSIALEAQRQRGGESALIHHMSYERYEAFAEGSQAAETKRSEQSALFKEAGHIFAVGPLLAESLADLTDRSDGHVLIPGLAEIEPRMVAPRVFKVLLSGRLSPDTRKIKQAYLGLAGFGHAVALCDGNSGYPDILRGEREPAMRLRGVDFENDVSLDAQGAEAELRAFVESHAGRVLPLSFLPFTQDRKTLFEELRQSSVALMPSWHEGFGLVAWEAIAAGVPVIVSRKSGVYRLLDELGLCGRVLSVDPKGSNMQPFFRDEDRAEVAMRLIDVAKEPEAWRRKADRLRQHLLDDYTWRRCAEALVAGLGWPLQHPAAPATVTTKPVPVSVPASAAAAPTTCLLEMPGPRWQPGQGLALSQLLRAEERVVPFDAAHSPFLERQLNWATGTDTPRLSVRLLTGRGGTGKTRLALELCRQLQGQGWETGLLPSRTGAMEAATTLAASGRPCLVMVDYAETRQQQVLDLLKHLQEKPSLTSPVRLLLLARAGGDWWAQFPSQCAVCEALLLGTATSGPYDVPPLHQAVAARLPAYRTALQHFANRLQLPMPQAQPDLSAERFAHPLHLQMTALLALHGEAPGTSEALTRALLAHEKRYWAQAASDLGPEERRAAATLMVLSTLCGGFAVRCDAEPTWQQMGLNRPWLGQLWAVLQPLYPGVQGLDGLRPDLLGEALVAQALLGLDQSACLDAVLGTGSAAQRRHALTVLARVLRTRDDVASLMHGALQRHFAKCALEVCDVGLATPSPLTDLAIAAFEALPMSLRGQAAEKMKPKLQGNVLPLTRLAVSVNRFEKDRAEARWKKKSNLINRFDLVSRFHALSISQLMNGQEAEALAASQKALDLCLSTSSGVIDLNERGWIARVRGHHATLLSTFGRYDEAISMSEKALFLRRQLRASDPECFEPDLATSLNNHANNLAGGGRHDEAFLLSQEALALKRELNERLPERFELGLATSLSNHAFRLADRGQHKEALLLSQDALDMMRKLAARLPERFEPDYASSLSNHASHLADRGWHEEALQLSQEALDLRRKLAERLPERFEPSLATSLRIQSIHLAAIGHWVAALSACGEAATRLRAFARYRPHIHGADLGHALLLAEFLGWIDTGQAPGMRADIAAIGLTERSFNSLAFQQAAFGFLFAASTADRDLRIEAHACLQTWGALDQAQQGHGEDAMLMVSAVLHARGLPPLWPEWQACWHRFADQRQGHVPQWMPAAMQRTGAGLPEC
jgi:glycosyltransferase involved in cell wall biosynthesis/tetratricopeptide (TPR) repeat protein